METQINIRLSHEQKAILLAKAKAQGKGLGTYLRDLGLSDGAAGVVDSQAQAERVAGSTGASAPVAEPPSKHYEVIEQPESFQKVAGSPEAETYAKLVAQAPEVSELDALTQRYKGQGMTTPVARREARKALGL